MVIQESETFFYLNPETDKFHFIPWEADGLFDMSGNVWDKGHKKDPISVKIRGGLIANRLYQLDSGRQHYEQSLRKIITQHWNQKELLAETERIKSLVNPYLTTKKSRLVQSADEFLKSLIEKQQFIRQCCGEIMKEIAAGMPKWDIEPAKPAVIHKKYKIQFYLGCITGEFTGFVTTILVN